MTPIIQQAIMMGYTATNILDFLSRKIDGIEKGINSARNSGNNDDDILKFLSGKLRPLNSPQAEKQVSDMDKYLSNIGLKTPQERKEQRGKIIGNAMGAAATALGAYSAYRQFSGKPMSAISDTLSSILGGQQDNEQDIQQSQQQTNEESSPVKERTSPGQILEKLGLKGNIDTLIESGNEPNVIFDVLKSLNPKVVKVEKFDGYKDLEDIIKSYFDISKEDVIKNKQGPWKEEKVLADTNEENVQPTEGVNKDENIVITPKGVGKVKEETKNSNRIEINGKDFIIDKINSHDLPIPEKDLAQLYRDLLDGIEANTGMPVSRHVFYSGYDPNERELLYIPSSGEAYVYENVSEEEIKELLPLMAQRKTTGSNYIGAWQKGTDSPIGAAMHKFIAKRKKQNEELRKQGKLVEKDYKRKFNKIYNAIGPAEEALKENEKKEKIKERERIKKTKKPKSS